MLWSAGLEAPRRVWVHGWLLAQGERMSKSRGNFLDPLDFVARVRRRRRPLRRPARGRLRPRHRRHLGRLPAALQRRPRQRLRQPGQPDRLDGRPLPRRRASGAAPGAGRAAGRDAGPRRCRPSWTGSTAAWSTRRSPPSGSSSARANKTVDAEAPWTLAKAAKAGDEAAAARLRGVLGDLLEACRLVALAAAPVMPGAAPRVLAQLGYPYPWSADGNRRAGAPRRARLGRPRRRARDARRPRAPLPAPRDRGRRGRGRAAADLIAGPP